MPDPILDHLTDAQREAVTHIDGPMLVVAGAGSGKTRVVTRRIAYLIANGVRPHQILAMTFTNKAAGEMKERVAALAGEAPRWVGTFHSVCARLLRFDLDKLAEGRTGNFTIFDDSDQQGLVKQALKTLSIDDKRFRPRTLLSAISSAKCGMKSPDDLPCGSWEDDVIAKVYRYYERELRRMNAADFDDLLTLTVQMLEKVPGLKEVYHDRFRYLLIDEYQDTNRAQYRLMKLLTGANRNVHATGDPDQSIYSWRGADYRNIMEFQKDFPGARIVQLEQNYRSTQAILDAANALIRNNEERFEKNLFTENMAGLPPALASLPNDRYEAEWIVEKALGMRAEGTPLTQMAIFYRTHSQSRSIEEAFMREGVPYQIIGGVRFYERKEIKDLLAHLKILVNPRDAVSLRRIIDSKSTGVGAKTFDNIAALSAEAGQSEWDFLRRDDFDQAYNGRANKKLKAFCAWCQSFARIKLAPVDECVRQVINRSGLIEQIQIRSEQDPSEEDRLENIDAFLARALEFAAAHPEAALPEFLEDVALVAEVDEWDREADKISMMTLHSAKGLEFPCVFLPGLEEGLLPHENAYTKSAAEEERRLLYVGITRARERLFISFASSRLRFGQVNFASPSRFLRELPLEEFTMEDLAGAAYRGSAPRQDKSNKWQVDEDGFDLDTDWDFDEAQAHPDYESF